MIPWNSPQFTYPNSTQHQHQLSQPQATQNTQTLFMQSPQLHPTSQFFSPRQQLIAQSATTSTFPQSLSAFGTQRSFFIQSTSNNNNNHSNSQSNGVILQNIVNPISYQNQLSVMDMQERPDGLESANLKNPAEFTAFLESFADKDTYFCQICHNLLWQPLSCTNCAKIYCKECIGHWIGSSVSCPTCRERFQPKKVDKSIVNNLNKLTFACSAAATGCTEYIGYECLLKHQNTCEFRIIACANAGCEFSAIRREMTKHSETCEHCLLACQWCKRQIKRMNSVQHEEICEMKILGCENQGCCASLTRAEMNVHISECPFNIVRCEMCSGDFTLKDLPTHKAACDFMIMYCRGCNQSMFKKHIANHEDVCDDVEKQCPDCTSVLLRKNFPAHDQISCLKEGQRILLESKMQLLCENACLKKDLETVKMCMAQLYEQVQELVADRRNSFLKVQRIESNHK